MITRRRHLPSFAALQAFDAAARHMSFTRAADELSLTQGAISRQVRGLEEALGLRLFELVRRRIVLTELGRRYHCEVRRTLDSLEHSTLKAMSMADGEAVIELAALPTLCSRWLIPKLPSFLAQHASVSLNCTSRFLPFDFATEPFDAALHFGAPAWPGGVLYRLFDERMVAVCAERFRDAHDLDDEDGLQTAPLLQQSTRPEAWANYFDEGSRARPAAARGARFDQISMLIEAAIAGMGAALLPEFLIENELADGSLVRIGKRTLATQNAYYFVAAEDKAGLAHIVQFRQWLLAQAGRFRAYDEVVPTPPEPSLGA